MYGPPPKYGVRTNPETGKSETYELPTPANLEESRKELREFLRGNYQWHDDPYKAPLKPVEVETNTDDLDDQYADFYNN